MSEASSHLIEGNRLTMRSIMVYYEPHGLAQARDVARTEIPPAIDEDRRRAVDTIRCPGGRTTRRA
jgi:hypothetical protein